MSTSWDATHAIERQLMERWQNSQSEAGSALCGRLQPFLQSALRGRLGLVTSDELEDVLQVVFLRITAKRNQYDPGRGTVRAWSWRVAFHTALNVIRDNRRRRDALDRYSRSFGAEAHTTNGPDSKVADEIRLLRRCLERLDRALRREVLAYVNLGLREAGRFLAMPPTTLQGHVNKALKALEECLKAVGRPT